MITKLEASILWGNGFKLKDKEGNVWDIEECNNHSFRIKNLKADGGWKKKYLHYDFIGTDYHIICHSLDKLTQPIMHEGKECVSIVELAKIHDKHGKWKLNGYSAWDYSEEFYFDDDCNFRLSEHQREKDVDNQPALFAYMDSLHFDRFNWQERGLTTPK